MSYDIYLRDAEGQDLCLPEPVDIRGGTYQAGGTTHAWLNITYNYSTHFVRTMGEKGIRTIYGMTGRDSIPVLKDAIGKLGDDIDQDYWKATEGNAKRALENLHQLAELCPDGIWAGD